MMLKDRLPKCLFTRWPLMTQQLLLSMSVVTPVWRCSASRLNEKKRQWNTQYLVLVLALVLVRGHLHADSSTRCQIMCSAMKSTIDGMGSTSHVCSIAATAADTLTSTIAYSSP